MNDLAKEVAAPDLTQFNFSMRWVFSWIQTTLYELERQEDWNYGEIPGITAIVLDKPEKPTNWADKETRVDPNRQHQMRRRIYDLHSNIVFRL